MLRTIVLTLIDWSHHFDEWVDAIVTYGVGSVLFIAVIIYCLVIFLGSLNFLSEIAAINLWAGKRLFFKGRKRSRWR